VISPDAQLYIYELHGPVGNLLPSTPASFLGLWNEEDFSYLFFVEPADEYVRDVVHQTGYVLGSRHEMAYRDWQEGLPPSGVTLAGVTFIPGDYPSAPARAVLLDPSVVFGDGNHPTTRACLEIMRELVDERGIRSMLDLGTGTGILALAGAAMGIQRVVAVDRNELAFQTACENVTRNGLSEIIKVHLGEARFFLDRTFDLVVANLPFQVLRDLLVLSGVDAQAAWIVSGVNEKQAETLQDLLREQHYVMLEERKDSPWMTFAAARR